ncbi:hypothetical protein [Brevibacillus sp. SAFN-007a]|uniref:hypothetical protein n=1 Tax=Brevibacillus sp. SAFN-007a TaxID=3436862 RepID=UPI003F81E67C
MGRLFWLEGRNGLHRTQFKLVFAVLMFLALGSFLVTCYHFYGDSLTQIRSAHETSMLQGVYSTSFVIMLTVLLPLLATMLFADSFYADVQSGVYKSIITRTGMTRYVCVKAVCTFGLTFLAFFIPLMINLLLNLIAFPLEGYDNNYSLPPYAFDYDETNMFELMRLESPYLYSCLFASILSMFAGLLSLLAFSLYLYVSKGTIFVHSCVFFGYILLHLFFSKMGMEEMSLLTYVRTETEGDPAIMIGWMAGLLLISFVMISYRLYRFDAEL